MNIAIDISPLDGEHSKRGVGKYTKLLVEALEKYEDKYSYTFFTRGQKVDRNADLVHYPYFDPFFLTLPVIKSKPSIVTVHDLIPLVFPDRFPAGIRGSAKWQMQKIALKTSKRIITDSIASKQDIVRITGINADMIDVVYLAPSPVFKRVSDDKVIADIRRKYKLPQNFILYVGDVNWNKNVTGLLRAFSRIHKDSQFTSVSLVFVGKAFQNNGLVETGEINDLKEELLLENSVINAGYIPDRDLSAIYSMAKCLVQPSLYEGFGLPVLEAMTCGCPVVAADNSSLSEILGNAEKVNAKSSEDIARGISRILKLPAEGRNKVIDEGVVWAKSFTWRRAARETAAVYEKVASTT